eukprot:COSAG01_NODE_3772_length_5711_cov_67.083393_2_plen_56_part_00
MVTTIIATTDITARHEILLTLFTMVVNPAVLVRPAGPQLLRALYTERSTQKGQAS